MTTRVLYESWQLQCCGDPFAVGDQVNWTAIAAGADLATILGPLEGVGIDWVEEHHHDRRQRVSSVEGTVSAIRALWQPCEPDPSGAARGKDVMVANGSDGDGTSLAEAENGEYRFTGYIVTLD